jgi:hypothetical protein
MNSEMFPKTPITPISPEQKLSAVNEEEFEEEETLPLQPQLPIFKYTHRKSNSEVNIPNKKLKKSIRQTCSKDELDILKKENIEASFEGYINNEDPCKSNNENEKLTEKEPERNPIRYDSIRYSYSKAKSNGDFIIGNRRKSFLNQKSTNSNNLCKKHSQNRLSVNRSSINFQDIQNIKDLTNITRSFYVNNRKVSNSETTNNEQGNEAYYIKRLNNEDESSTNQKDNDSKFGTFGGSNKAAPNKLFYVTRKLSDVSLKHQRNESTSSNLSLPLMNNNGQKYKYDKINISPNLMSKESPSLNSKNSPLLNSKSPLLYKNSPAIRSSLSSQSFNANKEDFEIKNKDILTVPSIENNRKLSVTSIHEEDNLNLLASNIEKDKNMEKMMDNLKAMKSNINGNTQEKETKEGSTVFRPSWARNSSKHNSYSNTVSNEEKKEHEQNNVNNTIPQETQRQGDLVFTKRNSSLTRFSVVSARTRNSCGGNVSMNSKYYRYSVARNRQTYNNATGRVPIPSHHTKITVPHFNPNSMPQTSRKESIESNSSQSTLLMEGSTETNRIESMIITDNNNNNNNNKGFLFRDIRDNNKSHNVSNIKSEIEDIREETKEDSIEEYPFNYEENNNIPISSSMPVNMSSILQDSIENDNQKSMQNTLPSKFRKTNIKPEEVNKVNINNIPFLYNKEQANWESNMHTMTLYDEENPKPKKE